MHPRLDVAQPDPVRPGVVVFDLPPPADTAAPRIMLRLGAEANRQDMSRIEGAYTVLRLRELREDGFAGDWTSGAPLPVAEGYFCAWRATAERLTGSVRTTRRAVLERHDPSPDR